MKKSSKIKGDIYDQMFMSNNCMVDISEYNLIIDKFSSLWSSMSNFPNKLVNKKML